MVLTITTSRSSAVGDSIGNRAKFVLVNPVIPGGREFAKIYWRWSWDDEDGDHFFVGNTCPVTIASTGVDVYNSVVTLELVDRAGTVIDTGTTTLTVTRNTATDIRSVTKEGSLIRAVGPGADVWANEATGNDSTGDGTLSTPYRTLAKLIEAELADNQVWQITGRDLSTFNQAVFDWGYECSLDDAGGLTNFEVIDAFHGTTEPRPLFRLATTLATGNSDDFFTLGANDLNDFRFFGIDTDRDGSIASGADTGVFLATAGNGIVEHLTISDCNFAEDRIFLDLDSGTSTTHHTGVYVGDVTSRFGDSSINIGSKCQFVSIASCSLTNLDGQNDVDKVVIQNCRYVVVTDTAMSGWRTGSLIKFQVDDTVNSWVSGADRKCDWIYFGDGAQPGRHNDLGFQNQKAVADTDGFYGITLDATPATLEGVFRFVDINGNIIGPSEVWIQEAIRIDPSVHDVIDLAFRNNFAGFAATPGVPELEAYVYNGIWADMAASGIEIRSRLTCSGNTLMRFKSNNGSVTNTIIRQQGDDLDNSNIEIKNNLVAINSRVDAIVRSGGLFTNTDTDYDDNFYLRTNWMTGSSGALFADDDAGGNYTITNYLAIASHETNSGEGFFADLPDFVGDFDPATGNINSSAAWYQTGSVDDTLRYQFGGTIRPASPTPGHADFGAVRDTDNVIGTIRVSNWSENTRSDIQTCVLPLADGLLTVAAGQRITALNALSNGESQNVQWHQMGMPYPSGFVRYARVHFKVDLPTATAAEASTLPYPVYTERDIVFTSDPTLINPWTTPLSVLGLAQIAFDFSVPTQFGLLTHTHDFSVGFPSSLGTIIEQDIFNEGNSVIKVFRQRGRTTPNAPGMPSFWWELLMELGQQNHVKFWFNYGNSEVRPDDDRKWEGTELRLNGPITLAFRTISAAPLPTINVHESDYKIPSQIRAADNLTEVLTLIDPFDDVLENNPNQVTPIRHDRAQFPDGASQVFSGTFSFGAGLTGSELSTHNAEADRSMFCVSLDWDKHESYGPVGFTGPLPNNSVITNQATAKIQAARLADSDWRRVITYPPHNPSEPLLAPDFNAPRADPWRQHLVGGLPPFPGTSGNNTDFSAGPKLVHLALGKIPDFRAYRNDAYQIACRIYHYRETDVSQIDVDGPLHSNRLIGSPPVPINLWSNVGAWNGRPHFNPTTVPIPSAAFADVLGKTISGTVTARPNIVHANIAAVATDGWGSFDREHITANTQFCYALMTGDRWFVSTELHDMSELILMSVWPSGPVGTRGGADIYRGHASTFRLDSGFSPRSHGRNYLFMAWCALLTGRTDLQDRLIDQALITTGLRRISRPQSLFPTVGTSKPVTLDQFAFFNPLTNVPFQSPVVFPGSGTLTGAGGFGPWPPRPLTNVVATLPWQVALTAHGSWAAKKVLDLSLRVRHADAATEMFELTRDQIRVVSLDSWRRNASSGNISQPTFEYWFAIGNLGTEGIPMTAPQKLDGASTFDGWKIASWGSGQGKTTNMYGSIDLAYEMATLEGDEEWRAALLQIYSDGALPSARTTDGFGWGEDTTFNDMRLMVTDPWIVREPATIELDVLFAPDTPGSISTNMLIVDRGLSVTFVGGLANPFTNLLLDVVRADPDVFLFTTFESLARSLGFPDSTSFVFFLDMSIGHTFDLVQPPATAQIFNEGVLNPNPFTNLELSIASTRNLATTFSSDSPGQVIRLVLEVLTGSPFTIRTPLKGIFKTTQTLKIRLDGTMTAQNVSFEMKAGNTRKLEVFVEDKDGKPLDITGMTTAEWVLKEEVDSGTVILSKSLGSGIQIVSFTGGTQDKPVPHLLITLNPSDTQTLGSSYYHECEVSIGGDDATLFEGTVRIRPAAIV